MSDQQTVRYRPGVRVHVSAGGHACELNMFFVTRIITFLRANGYKVVDDATDADVVLVGGCGAYSLELRRGLEVVENLASRAPQAHLQPVGCLAKVAAILGSDSGRDQFGRRLVSPDLTESGLIESTRGYFQHRIIGQTDDAAIEHMFEHDVPMSAVNEGVLDCQVLLECNDPQPADRLFVMTAQGCAQYCTYCSIRSAKGYVKSRPIDDIIRTIQDGVERGFKEFILLADDCGSYGADTGTNFAKLLNAIVRRAPEAWLHIYEMFPQRLVELYPEIDPVVWHRVFGMTAPLQHVSPRLLKLMGRRTDMDVFTNILRTIRSQHPGMYLHGHFIYAFPTETRTEFESLLGVTDLYHTIKFNRYRQTIDTGHALLPESECAWRDEEFRRRGIEDGVWAPVSPAHRLVRVLHSLRKGTDDTNSLGGELERVLAEAPQVETRDVARLLQGQLEVYDGPSDPVSVVSPTTSVCAPKHLTISTSGDRFRVRNHAVFGDGADLTLDLEEYELLLSFRTPRTLDEALDNSSPMLDRDHARSHIQRFLAAGLLIPSDAHGRGAD